MATSKLHDAALTLFKELKPGKRIKGAKEIVAGYNEERRAKTAKLKPILAEMQAEFEKGETPGGCTSMKEWCKTYKGYGAFTYARVRQIITGTSGNEGKGKVKSLYREGDVVKFGKRQFKITSVPESEEELSKTKMGSYRLTFLVEEIVEPKATHFKAKGSRSTAMICGEKKKGGLFTNTDSEVNCDECRKVLARLDVAAPKPAKAPEKSKAAMISTPKGALFARDGKTHILGMQWADTSGPSYAENFKGGETACGRDSRTLAMVDSNPTCEKCKAAKHPAVKDEPSETTKPAHENQPMHWRRSKYARCGATVGGYGGEQAETNRSTHDWKKVTCKRCLSTPDSIGDLKRLQPTQELSEPAAKALAAAVGSTELTWAQKVVIPGSPEREQHLADLQHRREFPYTDPNEGDECEENSEEEVL